jgi:hypothetical protein
MEINGVIGLDVGATVLQQKPTYHALNCIEEIFHL